MIATTRTVFGAALLVQGLLCLGTTAMHAQAERPTMTVDFLVTTEAGEPVTGLTRNDVTLRVGGRDLAIHGLELIALGTEGSPASVQVDPKTSDALPPPFAVTRPVKEPRRQDVLLLLDEGTLFGLEQIVRDAVGQLLKTLRPTDRVGLVSTRPGGVSVEFTTDRDSIRTAIDSTVMGRGNTALCVGALIEQIRSLAEALPKGRSTTLVLISRGSGSATSALSRGPVLSGAGGCDFRREQLPPVQEAVSAAQINYHVFHVGGSGLSPNLDNLAGATGAESSILSFTDASAIARAIQGSSQFYRATVDTPPAGRSEYQRAELRVSRPDVKVRGPHYISIPKGPLTLTDASALLRGEVSRADLPLRVAAFASRNAGPQPIKLVVVIEPGDAKPLWSAIVSVVGGDGEVAGQWTARRAELARAPLVTAVPVTPGRYSVRVAASDEDGRGGIAEYEVTAALIGSGPVKLSAIALGVSTPNGFTPRLLFGAEPEALAYLEVYDVPASASISAVFETATTPGGQASMTVPGKVSPGNGLHMVTASLPIAGLPAGDTIVRVRVVVDGAEVAARVVRTLRKSAR